MEETPLTMPLTRPIALALILVGAALPAGIVAPMAGASGCPSGTFGTQEHIQRSSPLAETTTATELVHRVAHQQETVHGTTTHVNGVDAFVFEMTCTSNEKGLKYMLEDHTPQELGGADYGLAFYNEQFRKAGDTVFDKEREDAAGQLAGYVPADTRYIVVILEDGPLLSGIDDDQIPPEPYSATFELELTK